MEVTKSENEYRNGIAIVAGGSGGIGAAICEKLASRGVDVAFTYNKNKQRAEETAQRVKKHGRRSLAVQVDLTNEQSVVSLVSQVVDQWGEPSTVVYAAGPTFEMKYISQLKPEQFRYIIENDVFGCYNLIHASLTALRNTRGAFVGLSTPAINHYTKRDILSIAPKAAIHAVIRGVAVEEGRFGVRANSVGVGLVGDAGLIDALQKSGGMDEKFMKATFEYVPMRRLGRAEEIAEAVAFLASERASFVTGQLLMADGGLAT